MAKKIVSAIDVGTTKIATIVANVRSQDFQQPEIINNVQADSGGEGMCTVSLELPGDFAFNSSGMIPDNGSIQNTRRQAIIETGTIKITIS